MSEQNKSSALHASQGYLKDTVSNENIYAFESNNENEFIMKNTAIKYKLAFARA